MALKQKIWIVYLLMQSFYNKNVKVTHAVC